MTLPSCHLTLVSGLKRSSRALLASSTGQYRNLNPINSPCMVDFGGGVHIISIDVLDTLPILTVGLPSGSTNFQFVLVGPIRIKQRGWQIGRRKKTK